MWPIKKRSFQCEKGNRTTASGAFDIQGLLAKDFNGDWSNLTPQLPLILWCKTGNLLPDVSVFVM